MLRTQNAAAALLTLLALGCEKPGRDPDAAPRPPLEDGGGSPEGGKREDGGGAEDGGDPPMPIAQPRCRPLDLSKPLASLKLTRMFEELGDLTRPTDMRVLPDGRAFVVSQDGLVWSAPEVSASAQLTPWLDLRDAVENREDCCEEEGLFSIAFHPRFDRNGRFFVMYSARAEGRWSDTLISEFVVDEPGDPEARPDRDRERVLLHVNQPSSVHNGGQLRFGPDGMLYWSLGDGGGNWDPEENAQDTSTLLGGFSRVDVDRSGDGDRPYAIPDDNPFVDVRGAAPELFAYGFRNPFRFAFHPETGAIWTGDVGQDEYEELDIVVPGGNYGWKVLEGFECQRPDPEYGCSPPDYVPPIHAYGREDGVAITGGVFYTGDHLPLQRHSYLFADYGTGALWEVRGEERTGYEVLPLLETGLQIASFAEGPGGEIYIIDWGGPGVYRLTANAAEGQEVGPAWAATLEETGCFRDVAERAWTRRAVPYDVLAPLWSDGAEKERALALPPDSVIDVHPGRPFEAWTLPLGTATAKTFLREGRPLETRFLVQVAAGHWLGATYAWNDEGTDGTLVEDARVTRTYDGEPWEFPSRSDCAKCHTRVSTGVLGLRTSQVFGTAEDPLPALSDAIEAPPDDSPATWPALDDAEAPLWQRARAYLASNCAHCHQPGGPAPSALDLRFETRLRDARACNAEPRDDLGLPGARILKPGDPDASVLVARLASSDPSEQMPPLARATVDEEAVALVRAWVESLDESDCD